VNQRFVWVGHSCPTFPPLRSCGAGTPTRATADGTRFPLGLVGQLSQMKDHDANRHPGLWRVMQIDSEFVGLLLAFGFLLMGLVSMPIATWFFLGALVLGGVVALLLHFIPKALFGIRRTRCMSNRTTSGLCGTGQITGWIVGSIRMRRSIVADLPMPREPGCLKMSFFHAWGTPRCLKTCWSWTHNGPVPYGSNRKTRGSTSLSFPCRMAKPYFRGVSTQKLADKLTVLSD
jgi:hypothetical protein